MINFDVYRNNPTAAADLIAREGDCVSCPMHKKCGAASTHDYHTCFVMWMRFFKFNTETLESVGGFSDLLSLVISCDKCEAVRGNDFCYQGCAFGLRKWLRKKIPTFQESRQDEPAVSFNGSFLKKLAQAADKIEPGKEYTLTEIERLLRDSENEAEKG